MANLNRIILAGRLAADPEVRSTLDGQPMAKFRLAVDRPQGGADFFEIIAWRRLAEICRDYLKKGLPVLVEGRIQIRSYEDQSGQRHWATEIVARTVTTLDKSPVGQATPGSGPVTDDESVEDTDLASDLPF
ncbi:MAG: single-stranded DNA-binding protein [Candidatus Margulisbacteria bacterium]|nr:single-stranded DNA-binding protein [Candidatus Margulisiibacteriota bacterium]